MSFRDWLVFWLWAGFILAVAVGLVFAAVALWRDKMMEREDEVDRLRYYQAPMVAGFSTEDTGIVSMAAIFAAQDQEIGESYVERLKARVLQAMKNEPPPPKRRVGRHMRTQRIHAQYATKRRKNRV